MAGRWLSARGRQKWSWRSSPGTDYLWKALWVMQRLCTKSCTQWETVRFLARACCHDICVFKRALCNHGVNTSGKGNERGWETIWALIALIQGRDEGLSNLQFMASRGTWQMIVNDWAMSEKVSRIACSFYQPRATMMGPLGFLQPELGKHSQMGQNWVLPCL